MRHWQTTGYDSSDSLPPGSERPIKLPTAGWRWTAAAAAAKNAPALHRAVLHVRRLPY